MNANVTKQKRKLLRSECVRPPADVRDNTKARRAWLEAKLTEINARPNREAKIVSKGSYQEISVYEVSEVEGRLRFRGVCQFCGNSQVVGDGAVLVLHGYKRPGDGYIFGRCPGMGLRPLNAERSHTDNWLAQAVEQEAETSRRLSDAQMDKHAASRTLHNLPDADFSAGYRAKPREPRVDSKLEQKDEYKRFLTEWASKFPEHYAAMKADARYEAARQAHWRAESDVRHFQHLLDSNIFGTPLTEEVVA